MLRLAERKVSALRSSSRKYVLISKTAAELSPEVANDDYVTWTRAWKSEILGIFAAEIGSKIGIAWSDDAMSLVEESEKTGFKSRSFVSSILDRLTLPKVDVGGVAVALPETKVLGTPNPSEAVRRWVSGKVELWLFVDDVDKNFQNIASYKNKIASFFDACRDLTNTIPELRIRSAIRPNIWSILRLEFESLSHVDQYAIDLSWSESDVRTLIERRISGYLKRKGKWAAIERTLPESLEIREKEVIGFVFEQSMHWGSGSRPPHVVLYTLSKRRPRWMIELSKVATPTDVQRDAGKI
jgi:hypothetical protein